MNCASVRERLPERALGSLEPQEDTGLERHLRWCAACRKEDGELNAAAAILGFAAAPSEPDPGLEERVVALIQAQVHPGRRHERPQARRGRLAVASVVAAMVAVAGLGWGAVMAGRAQRSEEQTKVAISRQQSAADKFDRLISTLEFSDPENQVFIARLAPARGAGGGSAFTLVSPSMIDMAVVMVTHVDRRAAGGGPYAVTISGRGHPTLLVGRLKLDAGGSGMLSANFNRDLSGYARVIVRDAAGRIVLSGPLATRAALASPSP